MDAEIANLRCLESSVRNLIACLCRHDMTPLVGAIPSTGTISGDLYAAVSATVRHQWDIDTLSQLQHRYPSPRPIAAEEARDDGRGELPGVRGEVPDGGGSAEHRGVRGQADSGAPVMSIDIADAGSDQTVYVDVF